VEKVRPSRISQLFVNYCRRSERSERKSKMYSMYPIKLNRDKGNPLSRFYFIGYILYSEKGISCSSLASCLVFFHKKVLIYFVNLVNFDWLV